MFNIYMVFSTNINNLGIVVAKFQNWVKNYYACLHNDTPKKNSSKQKKKTPFLADRNISLS